MSSNSVQTIKNWTYTLPKNCSPIEHFLLAMKTELEMLESSQSTSKIHVVLDARQVSSISTYNKTKMISERVFLSYKDKIDIKCLRPATVCGLSERLRLDVTVNKLMVRIRYRLAKCGQIPY